MRRHVLLVGLPGVGKSAVGKLVADGLPAPLLDIDMILVRQMGMPVAQIFGMVGEPRFRAMERDAVATAQAREPAVIIPGAEAWNSRSPGSTGIGTPTRALGTCVPSTRTVAVLGSTPINRIVTLAKRGLSASSSEAAVCTTTLKASGELSSIGSREALSRASCASTK